jgi:hypothetical protein
MVARQRGHALCKLVGIGETKLAVRTRRGAQAITNSRVGSRSQKAAKKASLRGLCR